MKPGHITVSKVYSNSCIKLQLLSFLKKNPASAGVCVCVTHLHRCKTSMSYLFFHAGGSSTIASLLPTKTLAIGGDTRPDQSGVPAIFHCDGKGLSQVP